MKKSVTIVDVAEEMCQRVWQVVKDWVKHPLPGVAMPIVFLPLQAHQGISVVKIDNHQGGIMSLLRHLLDEII